MRTPLQDHHARDTWDVAIEKVHVEQWWRAPSLSRARARSSPPSLIPARTNTTITTLAKNPCALHDKNKQSMTSAQHTGYVWSRHVAHPSWWGQVGQPAELSWDPHLPDNTCSRASCSYTWRDLGRPLSRVSEKEAELGSRATWAPPKNKAQSCKGWSTCPALGPRRFLSIPRRFALSESFSATIGWLSRLPSPSRSHFYFLFFPPNTFLYFSIFAISMKILLILGVIF